MFKVSDEYKKEINKLGGRSFVSKVLIRDKTYNDDLIIDMSLEESVNPGDNFSLGSVVSNSFNINLINEDEYEVFDNAIVKPYIGLKLEQTIEYISLGIFTVSNVTKKNKKVKLECVDNMIKLEEVYFSDLSYPANINAVLKEICSKAEITCNSTLPNYSIEEIKGYSLRQAVGIIATLCGCFAKFNRIGELEISTYKDEGLKITPDIFFTFENNDKEYTIEKITAKRGEKTFSKGADIGREIQIDNPVITEDILNDLYTKYKGFSYMPYSLKWQGNPAVQAGDRVTIVGLDGKVYNTLIMEHKLTYKGSISSEIKATGNTKAESKFDRKGSITQAMENYAIEQATIKKALIDKADINELNALNGKIQILYTEDLTGIRADIKTIKTKDLTALESKLTHALIGKADINELNVAVERVGILEGKTLSVENQLAGNLTAKNFHANAITAGSGIIAEGAIGSAQISDLGLNKLRAGDISTSKFRIISANGSIQIVGNQLLVNRDNITRVVLGEYRKQDNTTDYGLLIRAKDGKTIMFDSEGVHNAGITNGSIDNNKVADNANIAGNKLDINSVIREVNNNGTETIKGTKVTVGDRTLDVELSTQKNTITEHGKELSTQKASIQALDNVIKLKVDNQTFTQATTTINSNINNALNSAKEFTTAQIRTTNSNLSKATSEINILKEQINTKVGQVDINKSIQEIKIGGRNYIVLKNIASYMPYNTAVNENGVVKLVKKDNTNFITLSVLEFTPENKKYTLSGIAKLNGKPIPKDFFQLNKANTYNSGDRRVIIKDNGSFEITETWTGNTGWIFHTPVLAKPNDIIIFEKLKFEEGEFATTYTEAPEDLNSFIINNIKVVTDKINDVSTKLVQAKDSLQASVNSLNSTTQTITTNLTNTTNNLNNKIDNIQIGGRNLVRTSNIGRYQTSGTFDSVTNTWNLTATNGAGGYWGAGLGINGNKTLIPYGQSYILSFEVKVPVACTFNADINCFPITGSAWSGNDNDNVDKRKISNKNLEPNKWVKCWISYENTSSQNTSFKDIYDNTVFGIINNTGSNMNFQIRNVKGELGTKATDWTPAPEDVESNIDSAKQQAISSANSHADAIAISKSNEALNNAKTYTNAQITTVNTRVSSTESSINILKGQISTKVSQSDIDRTVNNIKIGGTNLVKDSAELQGLYSCLSSYRGIRTVVNDDTAICGKHVEYKCTASGTGFHLPIFTKSSDKIGKTYTWSFWGKCNVNKGGMIGHESGGQTNVDFTTTWKKYTYTWKFIDYTYSSFTFYLNWNAGEILYIKDFKIEEGNKATDWTPAPQDVNKQIQDNIQIVTKKISSVESTFTQKTNNINAAVSSVQSILKTKADGSTVSSIQSQLSSLNIGVNGIKLEVSKKVNKDSIISAINQSAEEITIDASRIKLNGLTTFASGTGLKAIEIQKNSINFYDWEGSERQDNVGTIYSVRVNSDSKRVGLAVGHEGNALFNIVYKENGEYYSYIEFDKYNINENKCPINICEDVCLRGNRIFLSSSKVNSFYESADTTFILKAKHGVKIIDTDTKNLTALLGSDRAAFSKWNQNFNYAEFFPGGFNFVGNDGRSLFWLDDGSRNIYTKSGVNMRVQGDLSVTGSKNRIVDTIYGDLALNAIESTECWFTDIGIEQNRTDNNGDCIIWFDNKFLSTVNTRYKYKIDVTPIGEFASNGKLTYVRVVEKTEKYFKVRGTPNTLFDWTITAKQKGYENTRLEVMEKAS